MSGQAFRQYPLRQLFNAISAHMMCACIICASILAINFSSPALAQTMRKVKLCNHTSYFLNVALAVQVGAASQSKGWQKILPGACKDSTTRFAATDQIFVYALSDEIYSDSAQRFEGAEHFCISFNNDFDINGRRECRKRGYTSADFSHIDNSTANPRVTFSDPLDFVPKRAKIAATQRLLRELGYNVGHVDGFVGQRTLKSLYNYQKKNNLSRLTKITPALLNHLYKKLSLHTQDKGFILCNKTDDLIWAAIGRILPDHFKTEGWLQINPRQCRKGINETLNARYYFVYAEAVDEKGNPIIRAGRRQVWTGDVNLCTKPTRFVIKGRNNCKERGLDKTSFMKIDTGTQTNWVLNLE